MLYNKKWMYPSLGIGFNVAFDTDMWWNVQPKTKPENPEVRNYLSLCLVVTPEKGTGTSIKLFLIWFKFAVYFVHN